MRRQQPGHQRPGRHRNQRGNPPGRSELALTWLDMDGETRYAEVEADIEALYSYVVTYVVETGV